MTMIIMMIFKEKKKRKKNLDHQSLAIHAKVFISR